MARAPLVLIVSAHEWASRSLDTILAPKGYGVLRAYNGRQALERTKASSVDAVFIDRSLPDMRGEDLCRMLLEQELVTRATPIIMVTSGFANRELRVDALTAGAWEVVALPVDAEELLLRVERFVRAKMEVDRAHEEALIDAVTGLYSREGVSRRVQEVAAAAERFGRPIACIVFVPPAGTVTDEGTERTFLSGIAEQLRGATRRSDILGRIGPREFAIIAPDTSPDGARVLAERLSTGKPDGPRTGVCAVADLKGTGLSPLDLVFQASLASRQDASPLN